MKAVVLDLFGTLFQLEPLGKHLEAAGVPASSLRLWFARILRDAWALEVAGQYRPFREVAGGALEVLIVERAALRSGGKWARCWTPSQRCRPIRM